jgi:hypothetical protein
VATSVLQICNQALSRVGVTQRIESLDEEDSEAARACDLWFEQCRDALLTEVPWPFATKTATLNQIASFEPLRRMYGYTLPDDCLKVQEIWTGVVATRPGDRYAFEYEQHEGVRVLVTDQSEVDVVYTARVEDPLQWTPLFIDALAWSLACELSIALEKGDRTEYARQRYAIALSHAAAVALGEPTPEPEPDAGEIAARG